MDVRTSIRNSYFFGFRTCMARHIIWKSRNAFHEDETVDKWLIWETLVLVVIDTFRSSVLQFLWIDAQLKHSSKSLKFNLINRGKNESCCSAVHELFSILHSYANTAFIKKTKTTIILCSIYFL